MQCTCFCCLNQNYFPVFACLQFVVTMFWALYLYDRDLVYPRLLDNFIPQWLNHGMVSARCQSSLADQFKRKRSISEFNQRVNPTVFCVTSKVTTHTLNSSNKHNISASFIFLTHSLHLLQFECANICCAFFMLSRYALASISKR